MSDFIFAIWSILHRHFHRNQKHLFDLNASFARNFHFAENVMVTV